ATSFEVGEKPLKLAFAVGVDEFSRAAALLGNNDPVKRWYRRKHPPRFEKGSHITKEESEQERPNVGSVNVSIAHNDHSPVPNRLEVEIPTRAGTDHFNDRTALG